MDSSNRRITYEVGRHAATAASALSANADNTFLIDSTFPTSSVLCEDFAGLAKKFSNFSGSFTRTNLAGVVERIAKGLACSATYSGTTTATMRAGQPYRIVALGTLSTPMSACEDSVYVPRLVDNIMAPDVFAVIASAVAGEGSQIVSDVVALNNRDNTPIVSEVKGTAFSRACVDALRLLGANFAASDAGDVFAYAITRGIHSVVSVVGHTDEGAVMRSLLRKSGFSAPFGGIHYGLAPYVGLPALASASTTSVGGYVDAIALKTAALVAHCDPGVVLNNNWFPTILIAGGASATARSGDNEVVTTKKAKGKKKAGADTAVREATEGSGSATADIETGEDDDDHVSEGASYYVKQNRGALQQVFGAFADKYCTALAKLFGFFASSGLAARHFCAAPSLLSDHERHLAFVSVAPFFWIEPTSLIPHDFTGYVAETEGFAAWATAGTQRTVNAFEECHQYGAGSSAYSYYVVKMRSARSSAFLAHWNGNTLNGLSNIKVKQLDPNAIVHPGGNPNFQRVSDRVEGNCGLNQFLWTRGQSPFAAPSEFINITGTMGIMVNHLSWEDDGALQMNHVPQHHEFANATVTFSVSVPSGIATGPSNFEDTTSRRARTKATRELASANLRRGAFGSMEVLEMPTLTSAPVLPSSGRRVLFDTSEDTPSQGVSGLAGGVVAAPATVADATASTAAATVELHHDRHRAPVVPRGPGVSAASSAPVNRAPEMTTATATPVAEATGAAPAGAAESVDASGSASA